MIFLRERVIVFLFPLLFAAPFLHRAFFVDDSYFVQIATWLKDHPQQPYDFTVDDAKIGAHGWESDGFVRMVNPLAHHYYLALLMKIGGDGIRWLRFGCVFLSCWGALFIFEMARRWTYHPLLATLTVLTIPAYLLTSYSLLIDGTVGFLFFAAIYFFIRGGEVDSLTHYLVSGLAMGLAMITKYPSAFIVPLTAAWILLRGAKIRRIWPAFLSWAIGISVLLAYSLWTEKLYGAPHILAASHRMVQSVAWPKTIVFFVFLSGTTIVPLLSWAVSSLRGKIWGALLLAAGFLFFSSSFGGFSWGQSCLLSGWFSTSFLFVATLFQVRRQWEGAKDFFLIIWLLGFIGMMLVVMGWVAARYYVIALPAIGFLVVRLIEIRWPKSSQKILKGIVAFNLLMSLSLAYADFQQANPARNLPHELESRGYQGGPRHFYLGDSFTMSYLKDHGWVPCFQDTTLQTGDWVLAKEVTMPQMWFYRENLNLHMLAEFNFPSKFPLKVMDNRGSAGWYASVWGALPFTFSPGPWERFRLFEVGETSGAVS